MSDWISLDPSAFQRNECSQVDGVEIIVGLSPYDVPEKVRGYFNDEIGRFVIEFQYLGNEEERVADHEDKHVKLLIGNHSNRLYEIHIDVEKLAVREVGLKLLLPEVDEAIGKLASKLPYSNRKRHYELAKDVISENREKLLAGV